VSFDLRAALRKLALERASDLPVLSVAAQEALALARKPDTRIEQILSVLEREPSLAARVLAVASSSFYARGGPATSLRQALVRLGTNAVRDVLTMAVYSTAPFEAPGFVELVRDCFEHCVLTARGSRELAHELDMDGESAFVAGLLHDLGRARCFKIAKTSLPAAIPRADLLAAIDEVHQQAGGVLARAWKLPGEVVDACEKHHRPAHRDLTAVVAFVDGVLDGGGTVPAATEQVERARVALELTVEDVERLTPLIAKAATSRAA
jgi:putative nucleotidyltransferase with HDIG domain